MVTVATPMFIVPCIGNIVGQVIQVHLSRENLEQVTAKSEEIQKHICDSAKPPDVFNPNTGYDCG